jgi:hypothetical protein
MHASHWPVTNSDEALIYIYIYIYIMMVVRHQIGFQTVCRKQTNRNKQKQERQSTYKRNIEPRSPNQFCSGKAVSATHYECVFVALVI